MNYSDPDLQDRLAADYVAGVLRGRATPVRRPAARGRRAAPAVRDWEERLLPLAWPCRRKPRPSMSGPPSRPASDHGRNLCRPPPPRAPPARMARWSWWRTLGAGSAAAMVVLAFLVLTPSTQREGLRTLAVLSGDQAQAALVLNRLPDKVTVRPAHARPDAAGWRSRAGTLGDHAGPAAALVGPGPARPDQPAQPRLPPLPGDTVAVTLEPPGFAHRRPTGPVVLSGPVI